VRFYPPIVLLLTVILILPAIPAADAGSAGGIVISRVCASFPGEFITISNYGPAVDVRGWMLSDGEGSVTFNSSFAIPSGGSLTWTAPGSFFRELYPDESSLSSDRSTVVVKGSLKLADTGDQVFLFDENGNLRDVVCYGNIEPQAPWTGPPAALKKGNVLIRTGVATGNNDWAQAVPGIFSISTANYPVEVRPVLYPDGALPELVREIDRSRSEVRLACYLMENWTLARHLAGASVRGVNVTVLLEGRPVGGVSENGAAIAYYLQDSGVEVWTMRSGDSFRRYDYLHAKYAVFDGTRLFVASENMADSSFSSNRGWAAIVEGRQISSVAEKVFERDLAAKGVDVFPLNTSLARVEGGPGRLLKVLPPEAGTYAASASLVTSPGDVRNDLIELISGAQERILVQQMRIDEAWLDGENVLSFLCGAADRGVSVRIQLDSGLGTEEGNTLVAGVLNRRALEEGWDLECRLTDDRSPFGRLHNKGVIVDDTVVVGSANWVDGSMLRNREMAVMLRSERLVEVFVQWFEDDWKGDAVPPVIELPWHYLEVGIGEPVILDATGCYDMSGITNMTWDLNGDGSADLLGPMHAVTLGEGEHNIILRAEDSLGNIAMDTVTVVVKGNSGQAVPWLLYAPLPLLLAFLLLRRSRRL